MGPASSFNYLMALATAAIRWQHHTTRGAISGALKKLGLAVEASGTREVIFEVAVEDRAVVV